MHRCRCLLLAILMVGCSNDPGHPNVDSGDDGIAVNGSTPDGSLPDGGMLPDGATPRDASGQPDVGTNGGTPGRPWEHVSPWLRSPESSMWDSMAYHQSAGRMVLVVDGETVAWDGSVWERLDIPGPPPREGHVMVYDAAREQIVLFGGRDGAEIQYDDTWLFDGASWTEANPTNIPPSRYFHGMAYDASRERVVMHGGGGFDGTPGRGDTWEWDGSDWIEQESAQTPGTRSALAMAYDAGRERVVLFGGSSSAGFLDDLWEWDGEEWREMTADGETPMARQWSQIMYDEGRGTLLLIGGSRARTILGDVWSWDGTVWTDLTSEAQLPARHGHAAAYDPDAGQVMLFGGAGPEGEPPSNRYSGTLALPSDAGWRDISPNTASFTAIRGLAVGWDPVREEVLLFGGQTEFNTVAGETWRWDGTNWHAVTPDTVPTGRAYARMATDEARGHVVMFGGLGTFDLDATWLWDGNDWTSVTPDVRPAARSEHLMGYDAARERVVIFGGLGRTVDTTVETWEWDGTEWELVTDGRDSVGLDFIPTIGLFPAPGGGLLAIGERRQGTDFVYELWHWDGTTWTMRSTLGGGPAATRHATGATDHLRGSVIVYGGSVQNMGIEGTWEVADDQWRQLDPELAPPPALAASMVWQPTRNKILMVGGGANQTWEWNGAVAVPRP